MFYDRPHYLYFYHQNDYDNLQLVSYVVRESPHCLLITHFYCVFVRFSVFRMLPKILVKLSSSYIGFFAKDSFQIFSENDVHQDSELKLIAEVSKTFHDVMFSKASFIDPSSDFESSSTLQLVADLNSTEISAEPLSPVISPPFSPIQTSDFQHSLKPLGSESSCDKPCEMPDVIYIGTFRASD